MSEREIRETIQQLCHKLDVRARAEARRSGRKLVYPLIVGAGLLVANCDDDPGAMPDYGVPSGTETGTGTGSGTATGTATGSGTATGGGGEGGTATGSGGAGGAGATGGAGGAAGGDGGDGGGPLPPYMAPEP